MAPEIKDIVRARLAARSEWVGECLQWTGQRQPRGYGTLKVTAIRPGQPLYAHRLSWELANGQEIPAGMFVCHRCDNPSCINPAHLFLGTHRDNMSDMKAKGRGRWGGAIHCGTDNAAAVLNEAQVLEIRRIYRFGATSQQRLADMFNVSLSTVSLLLRGGLWASLPGALTPEEMKLAERRNKVLARAVQRVEVRSV